MAQQKVIDAFIKQLDKVKTKIPTLIGATDEVLDVTFDVDTVAEQFREGIQELVDPFFKDGTVNQTEVQPVISKQAIKPLVQKKLNDIRKNKKVVGDNKTYNLKLFTAKGYSGPGRNDGDYIMRRSGAGNSLTFRFVSTGKGKGTGANDTKIRGIVKAVRDDLYRDWLKTAGDIFGRLPRRGSKADKLTNVTEIGHELSSTRGAIALQVLKKSRPNLALPFNFTVFDVVEQIQQNLGLDVDRNYKKNKIGNFDFRYLISTNIMKNFTGSEDSDFSSLKEEQIAKAVNDLFTKKYGPDVARLFRKSGSKKPVDIASEDMVLDLIRPLTKSGRPDRRYKINKNIKASPAKPFQDKLTVKKGKKVRPKTGRSVVALAGITQRATKKRPEKKERQDQQTLLRLEKLINKRLPAEIRRNMGRPALINRTGRFSNSAEITDLRYTGKGIAGEYTYLLSPYETFENTGDKRWPGGYNPKPLIAKSIRNLAMQYTSEKLVSLRRV